MKQGNQKKESTDASVSLHAKVSPDTVYVTTVPGQSSYADIAVQITNTGAAAVMLNGISIQLPADLFQPGTSGGINPVADATWNFGNAGAPGVFEADPANGSPNPLAVGADVTLTLQHISLNNTTGPASITVIIQLGDGSEITLTPVVSMEPAKAKIKFFNAQPGAIEPGETSILSWECEVIDSCIITPAIPGYQPLTLGNVTVSPVQDYTSYTLDAFGAGIHLQAQVGITLTRPQVISFGTIPANAKTDYNTDIELVWATLYADQVGLSSSPQITLPATLPVNADPTNAVRVGPLRQSTSFVLTPIGNNQPGTVSSPIIVDINPPSATFTADKTSVWQHDPVILSWNIKSAATVSLSPPIEGGPSLQNLQGSITVNPDSDVTYTLTVTGAPGTDPAIASAQISVTQVAITSFPIPAPIILTENVNGNAVTLSWQATAQKLSINNGVGDVSGQTSVVIQAPADGAVYVLTAGTFLHPDLVTAPVTITNTYGPFTISSLVGSDPGLASFNLDNSPGMQAFGGIHFTEQPFGPGFSPSLRIAMNGVKTSDGNSMDPLKVIAGIQAAIPSYPPYLVVFFPATSGQTIATPLAAGASVTIVTLLPVWPPSGPGLSEDSPQAMLETFINKS